MENKKVSVLLEMAEDNDGYVSISDATRFGIAPTFVSTLVEQGLFLRLAKGLYIKKGYEPDSYYLLHYTYKKAVFGYASSLYLHGIENKPEIPDIVLPLNYMTSGIKGASCRHVGKKEYQTGQILSVTEKGNLVPCYDLERLYIETIKRQSELDKEVLLTRLRVLRNKGLVEERLQTYAASFHLQEAVALSLKLI